MKRHEIRKLGGPGSGHHGHKGIPGHRGGSASSGGAVGQPPFDEVKDFVEQLTISGGDIRNLTLSPEAREFLKETVTKDSYHLYRGIALIKGRVTPEQMREVRGLRPGDPLPDYLAKRGDEFVSWSGKKGVASYYSQGKVSVIAETTIPKDKVVMDTRNLQRVLEKHGRGDLLSQSDYDYFKDDAEVIVERGVSATILSVK